MSGHLAKQITARITAQVEDVKSVSELVELDKTASSGGKDSKQTKGYHVQVIQYSDSALGNEGVNYVGSARQQIEEQVAVVITRDVTSLKNKASALPALHDKRQDIMDALFGWLPANYDSPMELVNGGSDITDDASKIGYYQVWRSTRTLSAARAAAPVVVLPDVPDGIYVIGGDGNNSESLNDVWRTADGQNWTRLYAGDATHVKDYAAALFGKHIYVMGGYRAGSAPSNEVWRSNNGVTWEQMPTPPWSPRYELKAIVDGEYMYILGGGSASNPNLGEIWRTADGQNWTQVSVTWASGQDRFVAAAFVRMPNGEWWHIGGTNSATGYLNNYNAGRANREAYVSADKGQTWTSPGNTEWNIGWGPYNGQLTDESAGLVGTGLGIGGKSEVSTIAYQTRDWDHFNPDVVSSRYRGALCSWKGNHYFVGGRPGGGSTGFTNEVFRNGSIAASGWTAMPTPGWAARGAHYAIAVE